MDLCSILRTFLTPIWPDQEVFRPHSPLGFIALLPLNGSNSYVAALKKAELGYAD